MDCSCDEARHDAPLIALTGGPGAGKSALLEVARRHLCDHALIVPSAAEVIFKGGFPRRPAEAARRCAQRAIFHVTRELERLALDDGCPAIALCDRGTLDGLAYWPGSRDDFFAEVGSSFEAELARYRAVIHLRTPTSDELYPTRDAIQIESLREAIEIDERILEIWSRHPRRHVIPASGHFLDKVQAALEVLVTEVPRCCLVRGA